jgi:hypothetical protein
MPHVAFVQAEQLVDRLGHGRSSPCREQRATHDAGDTWTTIRRPHSTQYRGGSSASRCRQDRWSAVSAGNPQRGQ